MNGNKQGLSFFSVITLFLLWIFVTLETTFAATFKLPELGDIIGEVQYVTIQKEETLLDIARQFDLGYNEIIAANPAIDPWLPEAGSVITVPTQFILPNAPRRGVVINLAEMRLYYFPEDESDGSDEVETYPIGIGQEGWLTPLGINHIVEKIKDPAWTVPESILKRYQEEGISHPKIIPPGPDNPLGRYALRLSLPKYLIHGTNEPYGIGRRVSHGCMRLYPEDIEIFFQRVPVNTSVWIVDQPYKLGKQQGLLYMEAHIPLSQSLTTVRNESDITTSESHSAEQDEKSNLEQVLSAIEIVTLGEMKTDAVNKARLVAGQHMGLPVGIVQLPQQPQDFRNGWVLQLGAYESIENARRMATGLKKQGLRVETVARANDGYCHVLVGPYASQNIASVIKNSLAQSTGIEAELLPADRHGLLASCQP